jgi:hypothetical protein
LCGGGIVLSALLILDIAPGPALAALWASYLSLTVIGQIFMGYQWDALLLETGFLAIFFAPLQLRPRWPRREPSRVTLWLLRWLLFRLMFSSGLVKLASGDPTWASFTALTSHYETQPLPTPLAWYAHQLPFWFQQLSALGVLVIELLVPFLIFVPLRRARLAAAAALVFLQALIALTGNYTFFNLLAVTLCVLLLDDAFLRRFVPERILARFPRHPIRPRYRLWFVVPLAAAILTPSLTLLAAQLGVPLRSLPGPAVDTLRLALPFHLVGAYGLFANMTTSRPEIVVEGSDDGQNWRAYEFRYKPGDLSRPPPWVAPHQPRLDWQMWFAALGSYEQNLWFGRFLARLLEGSPEVLALLERNPFPDSPPQFVRAILYDYHFTDYAQRSADGRWWRRRELRPYSRYSLTC